MLRLRPGPWGPSPRHDGSRDARVTAWSHLAAKAPGSPGDQWDTPSSRLPQTPWVSGPGGRRLCGHEPRPWKGADLGQGQRSTLRPCLPHLSALRPARWPEAWPRGTSEAWAEECLCINGPTPLLGDPAVLQHLGPRILSLKCHPLGQPGLVQRPEQQKRLAKGVQARTGPPATRVAPPCSPPRWGQVQVASSWSHSRASHLSRGRKMGRGVCDGPRSSRTISWGKGRPGRTHVPAGQPGGAGRGPRPPDWTGPALCAPCRGLTPRLGVSALTHGLLLLTIQDKGSGVFC